MFIGRKCLSGERCGPWASCCDASYQFDYFKITDFALIVHCWDSIFSVSSPGPYFPRRGQKPIGPKSNIRPPRPQFNMMLHSSQIEATKVEIFCIVSCHIAKKGPEYGQHSCIPVSFCQDHSNLIYTTPPRS